MKNKGITLIALVITIVILLILAGVTIATLTGEDGILSKAQTAKNENEEKTASEIINLKITNVQLQSYKEEEKMPGLQYLADRLYEDNDIQYIYNTSTENANIEKEKITVTGNSIFTKLNDYPYEFEINSSLRLETINGVKVAESNSESETIRELQERVSQLENLQNSRETTLIERKWSEGDVRIASLSWTKLEEISLAGYGSGKAIISFSWTNSEQDADNIECYISSNEGMIGCDRCAPPSTYKQWLRVSVTGTISYNQNTKVFLNAYSSSAVKPTYAYSILLIPD